MIALLDGAPASQIPVTDSSVLRGDGCFEALRSYQGRLFALQEHLDRLERSAEMMELSLPDREEIASWCRQVAYEGGDGIVRVVVTRGDAIPGEAVEARCVVLHHPLPDQPPSISLLPVTAPWHSAGRPWSLAGAKTISYAPNLASTRAARVAGFDEALLVGDDGTVLEGPTSSVLWVMRGAIETPSLDLMILDSITRRHLLACATEAGIEVTEGRFPLSRLEAADEVVIVSTVREVMPVARVGERIFEAGGPVTARLGRAFAAAVAEQIGVETGGG